MADLRKNLRDALRKMSYSTSVDQLRRRGVRQVNVLGLDRVVSLVEQAVYHSLRHRLMGLDRKQRRWRSHRKGTGWSIRSRSRAKSRGCTS